MNKRENFLRMMQGRQPARLPLDLPMTPPVVDEIERRFGSRDVAEIFDLDFREVSAWCAMENTSSQWRAALEALGIVLPVNAEISSMGFAHVSPAPDTLGAAYHLRTMLHPLEGIDDLETLRRLPWPRIDVERCLAGVTSEVERIHQAGLVAHGGLECTVFENAWYARSMESLFMDLLESNGIGDWLLDWHTQRSIALASLLARAGVDVVGLGDDIGTQRGMVMAPELWRRHIKPRLARVIAAIRQHQRGHLFVKYHSDGNITDVVGDLIEVGVDILNPVQPECMSHSVVIPKYKDQLAFWGMIGTQTTMPFGTEPDVRAAVRACRRFVDEGARIIIAPTHVLEPDVPLSNILTLVDEVRLQRLSEPLPA